VHWLLTWKVVVSILYGGNLIFYFSDFSDCSFSRVRIRRNLTQKPFLHTQQGVFGKLVRCEVGFSQLSAYLVGCVIGTHRGFAYHGVVWVGRFEMRSESFVGRSTNDSFPPATSEGCRRDIQELKIKRLRSLCIWENKNLLFYLVKT
jgi:hypothetical protein